MKTYEHKNTEYQPHRNNNIVYNENSKFENFICSINTNNNNLQMKIIFFES